MAQSLKIDNLTFTLNLGCFSPEMLSKRSRERGYNFFVDGYVHKVSFCKVGDHEIDIRGYCYRSMKKNESPHIMTVSVRNDTKQIYQSLCDCVAGYVDL